MQIFTCSNMTLSMEFFDKKFNVIDNKLTFENNEILFLKESNPENSIGTNRH